MSLNRHRSTGKVSMTTTPATTAENNPTAGWGALRRRGRPAGGMFGIDLAGLFQDDESDGGGFQGFFSPTKTTTYLKGRSPSTLTYKAAKNPAQVVTTSSFNLADSLPTLPQGGSAQQEEQTKEPETKADRLLSSFIGEMGDQSGKTLGAVGLGRALEYGYSPEDIISKAKTEGMTFGEQAARTLGLSELTQYQGPQAQGNIIGLTALENARAAGMSDDLIKQFAKQQGVGFGEKAAAQLNVPKVSDLSQYIGGVGSTPGALGLEAVNRAQAAGLSQAEIRDLASAQGLSLGPKAAQQLGVATPAPAPAPAPAPNMSSFIGGAGSNPGMMGLEAVNRARQSGMSDAQIRQLASQQGLGFGAAARSALGL